VPDLATGLGEKGGEENRLTFRVKKNHGVNMAMTARQGERNLGSVWPQGPAGEKKRRKKKRRGGKQQSRVML